MAAPVTHEEIADAIDAIVAAIVRSGIDLDRGAKAVAKELSGRPEESVTLAMHALSLAILWRCARELRRRSTSS